MATTKKSKKKTARKSTAKPRSKPAAPKLAKPAASHRGATKATSTRRPASKPSRANTAARGGKDRGLSLVEAALTVLRGSKDPMRVREIMDQIAKRGLWSSAGGKTPHATLAAAIIREIAAKGNASRFRKTGRGLYTARKAA